MKFTPKESRFYFSIKELISIQDRIFVYPEIMLEEFLDWPRLEFRKIRRSSEIDFGNPEFAWYVLKDKIWTDLGKYLALLGF